MPSLWGTKVRKGISFCILIAAVFGLVSKQNSPVNDESFSNSFLQNLIQEEGLGYVLLGEKPVLFTGYIPQLSWKYPIRSLLCMKSYWSPRNQLAKKGWPACELQLSDECNQFLIIKEQSPFNPLTTWIFVIHRDLFCHTIDQNRVDFETVLQRTVTGPVLLEQAEKEPLFSSLLQSHEGLLGIILGYGRHNAWLYHQGNMECLGYCPKQEDKNHPIQLPFFRADWEDPETSLLRVKYLKAREEVQKKYFNS